ncbi:peroxisomal ATPase PEX6-like [Liolophura sinensis]|uniref:peroxisomal ATPase PEX6-like n=1 Tax=Liolophura sinensis TaxID=3198878 RepID=UPI003159541E
MTSEASQSLCVKFNISQNPKDVHPFHLTVSEQTAERFDIDTDESTFVAGLRKAGADVDSVLLVSVRIRGRGNDRIPFLADDTFESFNGFHDHTVVVWCTASFLDHYEIDKNDLYFIKTLDIYSVQKVIIGAKNSDILQWTQKVKFGAGLIVSVCQEKVLVRESDIFLAPFPKIFLEDPTFDQGYYFDLHVLECVPVCQGLLTVNTEIVIILNSDVNIDDLHLHESHENELLGSRSKVISTKKSLDLAISNLCISDFSSPLSMLYRNKEPLLNGACVDDTETCDHESALSGQCDGRLGYVAGKSSGFVLRPNVLPKKDLWHKLLFQRDSQVSFDPLYIAGMSRSLMLKHGLFDGAIVRVSSLDHQPSSKGTTVNSKTSVEDAGSDVDCPQPSVGSGRYCVQSVRSYQNAPVKLAQVKMLKREFDSSKDVYISPLLLFNLQPCPSSLSSPLCVFEKYSYQHHSDTMSSVSESWDVKLPFAKEVQISLVNSGDYNPLSSFTEALKKYFQVPRTVSVGDVLAVRSEDDPRFCQNLAEGAETRHPMIYFKVIRVEPEPCDGQTYIADDRRTTLIQVGSIHSYIPARLESYLSKGDHLSYWEKTHLSGLEKYTDMIESLILPHLSSRSRRQSGVSPCILVTGQAAVGKTAVVSCVTRKLGATGVSCNTLTGDTAGATEARLKNTIESAAFYSPCVLLLQNIHVLGKDRERNVEDTRVAKSFHDMTKLLSLGDFPVIVVATTTHSKLVSHDMQQSFLHHVAIEVPSERERSKMIQGLLAETNFSSDIDPAHIAQRTAGFVLGDFVALLAVVKKAAITRICKQCRVWPTEAQEEALRSAGVKVQMLDILQALDTLQSAHSSSLGSPNIPDVRWEDIGGLANVKTEILDTIQLPLQHPELLAAGLRRSGVLLYGPPGSGKTLLAKAVATECSLNFLSVKGPELINKYIGQSEENVREVFSRARDASPCVIFFDELDSLAPNRGRSGDSGGVMDRVVSQMLAELDGLHKSLDVFVIGATNRPDLLDPALLRPGRFDKPLFLGVSTDKKSQVKILEALTRKFTFDADVNLQIVAEQCPMTLTGADFYALCSDAMLNAVKRKIDELEAGKTVDQSSVAVRQGDFLTALSKLSPSVSEAELRRYDQLRKSLAARK